MKRLPNRYTTTPKRDKIPHTQKQKSDSAYYCLRLVKVDTKVINASLTRNQCLQSVPPAPASTHAEIPRLRDATELKLGDVHYQTEPKLSIFPTEI